MGDIRTSEGLAVPFAEHLIPLMVATGAAGADPGARVYRNGILGIFGFRFG